MVRDRSALFILVRKPAEEPAVSASTAVAAGLRAGGLAAWVARRREEPGPRRLGLVVMWAAIGQGCDVGLSWIVGTNSAGKKV